MSTGSERVLEQFDRHLKKGDIFAAPRPGEPTSPARRRPSAAPHSWPFVQSNASNESSANSTRVAMMVATARPIC
jgi:hypothetical protein